MRWQLISVERGDRLFPQSDSYEAIMIENNLAVSSYPNVTFDTGCSQFLGEGKCT